MSDTKAVTPIDDFRQRLAGVEVQKQLLNYLNRDEDRRAKFLSAAVHVVQKIPDLLNDRASLIDALMTCAQFNLYPSAVSGEAYILPYKGKATFQLGYQGIITLLYRAGVDSINAQVVFENDLFEYQEGLEPKLNHARPPLGEKRGKPVGVYAVAVVNGERMFKVMDEEEVMRYREFSQSAGSKFSPWDPRNDPDLWMWKKTVIKQLAKILPKNETLNEAIARDNEDSTVSQLQDRKMLGRDQILEGGPKMADLTKKPNEKNEIKPAAAEGAQSALGFGVADNHSGK